MTIKRKEREATVFGGPWALLLQATTLPRSPHLDRPLVAPGASIDDGRRTSNGASMLRTLAAVASGFAEKIVEQFKRRARERYTIRSLTELDDRQLADIGIARCDIRALAHTMSERATEAKRTFGLKELRAEPVGVRTAANDERRSDAA